MAGMTSEYIHAQCHTLSLRRIPRIAMLYFESCKDAPVHWTMAMPALRVDSSTSTVPASAGLLAGSTIWGSRGVPLSSLRCPGQTGRCRTIR